MIEEKQLQKDEIDLVELVKKLWSYRKFAVKVASIFALIGLLFAFTTPKEYKAYSQLLPENDASGKSSFGGLGALAGLTGINLSALDEPGVLSPELYPAMVNSFPFVYDLYNDTLTFELKKIRTTPNDYFENMAETSLVSKAFGLLLEIPGAIMSIFYSNSEDKTVQDQEFMRLSEQEYNSLESFKKRISISINDENGLITIETEMPDPFAAAELTKKIELKITKEATKYQTDNARSNLEYVEKIFEDAKKEFDKVQYKLASFADRNKNMASALANIEYKKIQNEYEVAFEVYKGLASQVEQAKIALKKETPIFTVLEPVRIPEKKSSPKRLIMLIGFTFFGGIVAIGYKFIKDYF